MALKQVLEIYEMLDSAKANGEQVAALLRERGVADAVSIHIEGKTGGTDFVSGSLPGDGSGPTLGIIGRLGGVGARPAQIGMVSDGDGAAVALAAALKLADMAANGDVLPGRVRFATHVCPNSPVIPHQPVPFMDSHVDMETMNRHEIHPDMSAILTVDTTRGNRIINKRGFAISPTVKEGWILRTSEDLLSLMGHVTGQLPAVFALTMQDITPYGNGAYHLNSILQPATATSAPVVGVALTAEVAVPGSATGASQLFDIEQATRFCIEVAKGYTRRQCRFYDEAEYANLVARYGSMARLQGLGASTGA
ncbi:MAG: DUF1177 domain-containing protein [Anaerolineae bacterium]|nr:DUF1177 domain-containing protein [Thermoflexales bacterium]HQW36569.1 DUF1177 domain-containing protein [Thermoflexales bacterium]